MSRDSIYLDLKDNVRYVALDGKSTEGARTSLINGDVLVSITADIGICSYIDDTLPKPAFINQHVALVRFDHEVINSKFVAYFLSSYQIQKLFVGSVDQGAKAGMNLGAVNRIQTALPLLKEQIAIANALSDVDALISEQEKLIAKKQAIKTATMQQLLTGRTRLPPFALREDGSQKGYKQSELGEVPEDWEVQTIAEQHVLATGNTPPTSDMKNYGEEYLFVSPADLGNEKYILNSGKKLSSKGYSLARKFPSGSTLFTCIGSTIGKTGYASIELTSNQQINAVFPNDESDSEFTYYALTYIAPRIKELAGEQAVPLVNKTEFGETSYFLPLDKDEQIAIATILSNMDKEIQTLQHRLAKIHQIKKGMMQELLTGKTRLVKPKEVA